MLTVIEDDHSLASCRIEGGNAFSRFPGHHCSLWYSELPLLTVNILNGLCQQFVCSSCARRDCSSNVASLSDRCFCHVSDCLFKTHKKSMTPLTFLQAHSCSCWGVKISSPYKPRFCCSGFHNTLDPIMAFSWDVPTFPRCFQIKVEFMVYTLTTSVHF
jgi:hypothetical protein